VGADERLRQAKKLKDGAVDQVHEPDATSTTAVMTPRRGDDEGLTAYQEEVVAHLPTHKRVAVRGPHGLGKTGLAAITVLWFALTREQAGLDWKVLTTASAWRHLTIYLWPEIKKWANRLDWEELGRAPFNDRTELLDLHLKQKNGAASAVASSKPELIEGAHANHSPDVEAESCPRA
jgi:hypothetical protein